MAVDNQGSSTVAKTLDVLDMVASYGRPVRFSELLEHSPFPKASLYRFLQTLTAQDMLRLDPQTGAYTPGMRLVRMAHSAWAQSSLAPIARPWIDKLAEKTGETVHLAQLDTAHVLYVDKRNALKPVDMYAQAGKVGPAYCTGVGKAMLAFLPNDRLEKAIAQQSFYRHTDKTLVNAEALEEELAKIRQRGHAFDNEEHEPGIICCAVPILSRAGRVLGAISVTSTTSRTSLEALDRDSATIKDIAAHIAADAESWRFPES